MSHKRFTVYKGAKLAEFPLSIYYQTGIYLKFVYLNSILGFWQFHLFVANLDLNS